MDTGYKILRKQRIRKRSKSRTQRQRAGGKRVAAKQLKAVQVELPVQPLDGKLAVDVMDEQIAHFEALMKTLYPWDEHGTQRKGKSVQAYYWASEMHRDYVQMRAPFQSPRLSAVQIVPAQNRQQVTEVNVTILNEKGELEYTDAPEDDELKQIEHVPSDNEEAA
jgi:hypothetical protein